MDVRSADRPREIQVTVGATLFASFAPLPLLLTGGLAVLMRADLDFGAGAIGLAAAVFVAASAASAVPGGKLTERVGPRRAVYASAVMTAVCMLGIASLASSWLTLAGFLALGGFANGIAQPATNAMISRGVSEGHQGTAFGVKRSSFSFGEILSGLAVPLVAVDMGWRAAWVFAAIGLAVTAMILPKSASGGTAPAYSPEKSVPPRGPLVTLAIAGGFGIGAIAAMQIYFVESGVERGLSVGTAGALLAVGGGVGVVTRLGVGLMQDSRGGDVFVATVTLLGAGAIGFLLLGLGVGFVMVVVGTALAFGAGQGWTGLYMLGVVRMNPEAPGAATGRIEAGLSTGAVIGPIGFGLLIGAGLFSTAWILGSLSLLVAGLLVLFARRAISLRAAF